MECGFAALPLREHAWVCFDCASCAFAAGICPATLDLRFVPDDLVPPHEASSVATEVPKKFSGPAMLRSATGHTKVKCTWDEAPPQRKKDLMKKRFSAAELADMDLRDYLASSSESEAGAKGAAAQELKALVANSESEGGEGGEAGESDSDTQKPSKELGNMEATFNLKTTRLEEELAERAQKQGGRGVHTLGSEQPQSSWQKYLDKRKEKRREKRQKAKEERAKLKESIAQETGKIKGHKRQDSSKEEPAGDLELLVEPPEMEERSFNLRGPQRQAHDHGLKDSNAFQMDVHDRRLEKVLSSADFEIDPTNPEFRKSDGMSALLREKRKRKSDRSAKAGSTNSATGMSAGKEAPLPSLQSAGLAETTSSTGLQIFASQKRPARHVSKQEPAKAPKKTRKKAK